MFQIPQHILDDLRCSVCNGYLSSRPLMIKHENEYVCGKCYMIIPEEEKEKCLRLLALESLAGVFLFPCRYSKQGCKYNFPWDAERNHEDTCTYRYKNSYRNSTGSDFFQNQAYMKNKCDVNQNSEEYQNLTYLNLQRFVKNDKATELQNNINLSIEGGVVPKTVNKPEIVYSDVIVEEHIYDSLTPLINNCPKQRCFNCKAELGEKVYNCSQGHISCGNCKGSMCIVCVNIYEKETKSVCKYQQNGCKEILRNQDINKHQSNCIYRQVQCFFEPCKYKNILEMLKVHVSECHPDKVITSSELTKTFFSRDETLVILCHDKIFKLVYYYYKTFVEFFVTLIGSSEEATSFMYEISVEIGDDFLRRRSKCASWNGSMLEKGITFDRKDLVHGNNKKINFEILLKIYHQVV